MGPGVIAGRSERSSRAREGRSECVAEFFRHAVAAEPCTGAAMKCILSVGDIWLRADDDDPGERERSGKLAATRGEVGGVDDHEVRVRRRSAVEVRHAVDSGDRPGSTFAMEQFNDELPHSTMGDDDHDVWTGPTVAYRNGRDRHPPILQRQRGKSIRADYRAVVRAVTDRGGRGRRRRAVQLAWRGVPIRHDCGH